MLKLEALIDRHKDVKPSLDLRNQDVIPLTGPSKVLDRLNRIVRKPCEGEMRGED